MLSKLLALSAERLRLLGAAFFWLLRARADLMSRPAADLARSLGTGRVARRSFAARDAAWAVQAVGSRLGCKCLPQSLALQAMLRRAGFDSSVVFGVARVPSGGIVAHAWVACEGESLLQSREMRYEPFPPLPS